MRPVTIRRAIQNAAGSAMGIIRTTEALEAARDELARIRQGRPARARPWAARRLAYNMEWKEAIENYNLLTIAELFGARLADARGEPRQLPAPRIPRARATIGRARWPSAGSEGSLRDREKVELPDRRLGVHRLVDRRPRPEGGLQ